MMAATQAFWNIQHKRPHHLARLFQEKWFSGSVPHLDSPKDTLNAAPSWQGCPRGPGKGQREGRGQEGRAAALRSAQAAVHGGAPAGING